MTQTHSISIGIERFENTLYIVMKAVGKLTHADYQAFTPLLEGALNTIGSPHVKMLVDVTAFSGWELRAAWEEHLRPDAARRTLYELLEQRAGFRFR